MKDTTPTSSEDPLLPFLQSLHKVIGIQTLIATLFLVASIGTLSTIFLSSEYLLAIGAALCILLASAYILTSAYCSDLMRKKALFACSKIVQSNSKSLESIEKMLTKYTQKTNLQECELLYPNKFLNWNGYTRYFAWKYVHTFAEILFLSALDSLIEFTKASPLKPHTHATLANCYTMLANHYAHPLHISPHLAWPKLRITKNQRALLEAKNTAASKMAVEELAILKTLAPNELWVHDQLAISYRELAMPEEEIQEIEEIIRLCPDDHRAQLRLGILYFQLGLYGKGLIPYEHLRTVHPQLAEELISHYGSYRPFLQRL